MKFRNYIDPGFPRENKNIRKNMKNQNIRNKHKNMKHIDKQEKQETQASSKNNKTEKSHPGLHGSKVSGLPSKGMGARGERSNFQ